MADAISTPATGAAPGAYLPPQMSWIAGRPAQKHVHTNLQQDVGAAAHKDEGGQKCSICKWHSTDKDALLRHLAVRNYAYSHPACYGQVDRYHLNQFCSTD